MKTEDLFIAIGKSDDKLLRRSEKRRRKKKGMHFKKFLPVAVAAVVFLIIGMNMRFPGISPDLGKESGKEQGDNQDNSGYDAIIGGCGGEETIDELEAKKQYGLDSEDEFYICLSGPILPLTLKEKNSNISAERDIQFDFQKFDSFEQEGRAVITDSYALTNHSDTEQVIYVKYPYLASLKEMIKNMEMKTYVDGKEVPAGRMLGRYSGTDRQGQEAFLGGNAIEDYPYMLRNEGIQEEDVDLALLNKKVVVYEYKNYKTSGVEGACYAAEIKREALEGLYVANMNCYSTVGEETECYGFVMEEVLERGCTPMLIFDGEEPEGYKTQGYNNFSIGEDTLDDSLQAEMVRYESTFGEVLKKLVDEEIAIYKKNNPNLQIPEEFYYEMASILLADFIGRNTNAEAGDEWEIWANNISTIAEWTYDTVFEQYLICEITIPAGATVTYQVQYEKEGNYQSTVPDDTFLGNYGYDNMINLGTNLHFEKQSASIEDHGYIHIVKQNYGFDLENNIKDVSLDMNNDYYYLIVKRVEK